MVFSVDTLADRIYNNHGATEMAAGEPNEARWTQGSIQRTTVKFRYAGSSSFAVDSRNKLTTTWGNVKN